jgi:hypothetical protein
MFNINKAATIAKIALGIPDAVMMALKSYPPPISFVMAGLQLAASMAQLNQARSAHFDSATSAPSIGGGGLMAVNAATDLSAPGAQPPLLPAAETPRRIVNIYIKDSGFLSAEFVRSDLIPQINKAVEDGVVLVAHSIN